jgi:hypothetical protein
MVPSARSRISGRLRLLLFQAVLAVVDPATLEGACRPFLRRIVDNLTTVTWDDPPIDPEAFARSLVAYLIGNDWIGPAPR